MAEWMDATFWASVALAIFFIILLYLKVPGMVAKNLDDRAQKIRNELAQARKLREEARELLAEFQRKRREIEKEAEEIIKSAKSEAKAFAADAKSKTEEFIARHKVVTEQKIAQAEMQALADMRAYAVDVAIATVQHIASGKMTAETADVLINKSITQLKARLH